MFRLGLYQQSLSAISREHARGPVAKATRAVFLNFDCKADASRDVQEALDRPSD